MNAITLSLAVLVGGSFVELTVDGAPYGLTRDGDVVILWRSYRAMHNEFGERLEAARIRPMWRPPMHETFVPDWPQAEVVSWCWSRS